MNRCSLLLTAALLSFGSITVVPQAASAQGIKIIDLRRISAAEFLDLCTKQYQDYPPEGDICLDKLIARHPKVGGAYILRGVSKDRHRGDYKGALADLNKGISLIPETPNSAVAYNYRAKLKADRLNDSRGAIADYDRVIAINPQFPDVYFNRGIQKIAIRDGVGGRSDLKQALQIYQAKGDTGKAQGVIGSLDLLDQLEAIKR